MGLYQSSCKAETGLGPDILPQELWDARLQRSEARSLKQEEATQLVGW
ncbi:MAG: hypothetical protein YK1309IOTA_530002 [Marine Group I thaumarchaeote]|nr:MAG: hypothetical protein YK1309IOTA_530002 [Marine Group I thaumarchaeote]